MRNLRHFRLSVTGVLLSLIALALFSGCASAQTAESIPEPMPEPEKPAMPEKPVTPKLDDVIVTDKANGKTVSVKVGQRLFVRLPSNPSTGYEWSLDKTDEKLLAPDGETTFDVADANLEGAPTIQTLFFKAKGIGKVALELKYTRPWEKDKAPVKVYKITVNIVS